MLTVLEAKEILLLVVDEAGEPLFTEQPLKLISSNRSVLPSVTRARKLGTRRQPFCLQNDEVL